MLYILEFSLKSNEKPSKFINQDENGGGDLICIISEEPGLKGFLGRCRWTCVLHETGS